MPTRGGTYSLGPGEGTISFPMTNEPSYAEAKGYDPATYSGGNQAEWNLSVSQKRELSRRQMALLNARRRAQGPNVVRHTHRKGRSDFYKTKGTLHMDLPPSSYVERKGIAFALPRMSPERDLMEQMTETVDRLIGDEGLCEAKASSGRNAIAHAVGQVEMRRFEVGTKGINAILLPRAPKDPSVLAWLASKNILVIHP